MSKPVHTLIVSLFLVIILSFLTASSTAKSYAITSLSSEVHITNGACTLDVVETFEYEFTGSYSTIGRAFASNIDNVNNIAVVTLTSGYSISTYFDSTGYIIMYLSPATPESGTTMVSFQLSYTVIGRQNLFASSASASKNTVSFYYKDSAMIRNLTSTFIFDSNIGFTSAPTSSGQLITNGNQYSVLFSVQNLTSLYVPTVYFNPNSDNFNLCPLTVGGVVGIVIGSVAGAIILTLIFAFILIKGKSGGGGGVGSGTSHWTGNNHHHHNHSHTGYGYSGGGGGGGDSGHTGGSGFAN
ncbi:predicted protein [Naegleria gruberi]|uniref:Predicted protein n=1 Tax=Naegleria gruberi TaxID=5762 RepID=D2VFU4_NAEGR|nr:uncharacterized protein NAEGRDRAFT_67746 [Naegleria gruberi]EFC44141.1 predicted protein [Naegleria gruberi]|eukprot:XP_002676885.1 predicted protein [Naegleria gruberi strain NEG-M]